LPLASICTQLPEVCAPVVVTNCVVLPLREPLDGATPAPPPTTGLLAESAPEEPSAEPDEKYGTPPDVPETVRPNVPELVTGEPVTPKIDDGTESPTLVTVPPPVLNGPCAEPL
jgi:hypothetical protein